MGKVTLKEIKNLRQETGIGITACKEALEESNGDPEKAIEYLRKKGVLKAQKRSDKAMSNGYISSYVHNGQIGVLVELASETDFTSRNKKFRKIADEIALHVAASSPLYVSKDDVPEEVLKKEKEIAREKLKGEEKPEDIMEKIIEGQLSKFYEQVCLLEQPYVRDDSKKVKALIEEAVASFGERIEVRRFVRIVLGESLDK